MAKPYLPNVPRHGETRKTNTGQMVPPISEQIVKDIANQLRRFAGSRFRVSRFNLFENAATLIETLHLRLDAAEKELLKAQEDKERLRKTDEQEATEEAESRKLDAMLRQTRIDTIKLAEAIIEAKAVLAEIAPITIKATKKGK